MPDPRLTEVARVNKLEGNQARIFVLYLIHKGLLDKMNGQDLKLAFEIAESYSPESQLVSF